MKYKIAVFAGDGVGPELIDEGIKVIEKAAELDKFEIEWVKYPHGAEHFSETKESLSNKALKEIKDSCKSVYCGTFDNSKNGNAAENNVSSAIKNYFDQFVSLRPIRLLPNVQSPLNGKTDKEIDFTVIRENTEDFYSGINGRVKNGKNKHQFDLNNSTLKAKFGLNVEAKGGEMAYQIGVLSKKGCERVIKFAFEYAKSKNKKKIAAVDKANMIECYDFWRENVNKVSKGYGDIKCEFEFIDAAVMNFIRQPEKYEVIIAPNMFGDILGDLGTVMQGSLAVAARGNINPGGISMFEPVHGSAPGLKEKGVVNPIATIWAGAMMLDNIGQQKSADLMIKSIEYVLKGGKTMTLDLGGNNSTSEMGDAIKDKFIELHD
ncbi:3-isopropylmalate dehydrogenase [Candidatus Woesearchaeota archaeon]|jgi:3-isopropylmalate dehydrogenase|nr:3-isopropylmalate dehydrogenase [Candidatus Woesearchaeota archaeon]MDP6648164.1 isocitrate/isopropylmalate family dehydrogenase [Candidatus Woesearchaeota archaeon]|tara:strand:+ start:112134 stop:113264 length:1131 start_codon:yes stop_codon:yes gene_type:complete